MFAVLPWYHAIPKDGHPGDICVTSNGSGTYHLACRGGVLELQLGGPLPLGADTAQSTGGGDAVTNNK